MRVRVNTLLVSCILVTIGTAMLLPSNGISDLINTQNNGIAQSAGYGELTMLLVLVFLTWTGLIKADWKAWVAILAIVLLWEYPILARLYVKHYGLALPFVVFHELVFIGTEGSGYMGVLLAIYGCFLTLAALALSAMPVLWGKGKEVRLGRGFALTSASIIVLLLIAGTWERLRENPIPHEELNTFIVTPPPPPMPWPPAEAKLPICDPSVCSCAK